MNDLVRGYGFLNLKTSCIPNRPGGNRASGMGNDSNGYGLYAVGSVTGNSSMVGAGNFVFDCNTSG